MDQRFSRCTGAVLAACLVSGVFLHAAWQTREQPPPTGPTITIRGRVVASDTNLPFRDATVSLQRFSTQPAPPGREAMEWMASSNATVDSEGRFEFAAVAAGSYRLVASPAQTVMRYVQGLYPEASLDNPRALTVSPQQPPAEIVIVLPRGAAITGRVVDEQGTPYSYVAVSVREALSAGRTRAPAGFAASLAVRTDDNGSFRVFGLQAGTYIVMAQPPPATTVAARGLPRVAPYPPTYYPAVLSASEATRLRVRAGEDVGPIDIVLQRSRLLTIRGVLVDASGVPVSGVQVKLQKPTAPITADAPNPFLQTAGDGAFEIPLVAPGDYALTAYRYGGAIREFAWTPISVSADVHGVVVKLGRSVDVQGQVIFDTPPTESTGSLRIRPVEGTGASQSPAILVKEDGSFALEHLFGPVVLRAEGLRGWHIQSVLHGGRDITDEPTELVPGMELRVTLSERLGTLTGAVTNSSGGPVAAAVIVFAEDPAFRHERSTTTKMVYTSANGRYAVEGLRAGRYVAVAVPREASSLADAAADYYELLAKQGTRVTIRDREAEALDLKVFAVR